MPIRLCRSAVIGFVSGKELRRSGELEEQHGLILEVSRECG
jgi:hypothetical protein